VLEIDPPLADHVTAVLLVPVTVAVNCCVAPDCTETEVGVTETVIEAVTLTVAEAVFVGSPTLVAVTV
jgi:hypothetical protein